MGRKFTLLAMCVESEMLIIYLQICCMSGTYISLFLSFGRWVGWSVGRLVVWSFGRLVVYSFARLV